MLGRRAFIFVVISSIATGILVGSFIIPHPTPASLVPAEQEVAVSVSTKQFDGSEQVQVKPDLSDAMTLTSPVTGRVTHTECAVGKKIGTGEAIFYVNGQPLLALNSKIPFWRDLYIGSTGADVKDIQETLIANGLTLESSGYFDYLTLEALNSLKIKNNGEIVDFFSVEDFLWIPNDATTISKCSVSIGENISSGNQLAELGGVLEGLQLSTIDDSRPRVAVIADQIAEISEEGVISDRKFLSKMQMTAQFKKWLEDQTQPFTVSTRYQTPIEVYVIPPAAVTETENGKLACVATKEGMKKVEIIASELGQTFVLGDLPNLVLVGDFQGTKCS